MAEQETDVLIQDTYFTASTLSFWLAPPHPASGEVQGSQQKRSAHHKTMLFGSWTGCHASVPVHGSTKKNLICENTALSCCPAQTTEETPLGTTNYLQPLHLPLHDVSLSIRSTQQHAGAGRKTKQPFKKNALQCTDTALVERRKNKQQMLVTFLSTLLEGIQIYCD